MSAPVALQHVLARLVKGASLTETEAESVFESFVVGHGTPGQIGAVLMGLAARGETVAELTAAVRVMRRHAVPIAGGADAVDCCGTGGDGHGTLNISTAVAFVVAACGVPVAKHGNRAASSRSGAADVLGALGIPLASPELAERMLKTHGLTFMFAPNHHPAMKAVGAVRKELGIRTLFNLAGPLSNPAGVIRQLVGVYDVRWLIPVAEALRNLGSVSAWVVNGSDGLDELTITGPTEVAVLSHGVISRRTIVPEDAGLARATLEDIRGGDADENAVALNQLLAGKTGPYRDIVLLNAAATLIVAGKAQDLRSGVAIAAGAIDDGRARTLLGRLAVDMADTAP